jgi:hypothetical protein
VNKALPEDISNDFENYLNQKQVSQEDKEQIKWLFSQIGFRRIQEQLPDKTVTPKSCRLMIEGDRIEIEYTYSTALNDLSNFLGLYTEVATISINSPNKPQLKMAPYWSDTSVFGKVAKFVDGIFGDE